MYREYLIGQRKLKIFLGDITDLAVDAIVNSENNDLIMDHRNGPSVSAAIRRRAPAGFAAQVARLGPISKGKAVVTPISEGLPARYVIHAAVVQRLSENEHQTDPETLRRAVRSSLELANALGLRTVAFPAFGVRAAEVPKETASDLMIAEVTRALQQETSVQEVIFALLDPQSFLVFFERAILRHVEFSAPIDLSVSRRGERLELRLSEGGPVAASESLPLSELSLEEVSQRFEALQSAAQRRLVDAPQLLRSLGAYLWNFLLPSSIRERLAASRAANLILRMDADSLGIPLELAWDGESFLSERFRIARQVSSSSLPNSRHSARGRSVVLMCDSHGDLPQAHAEALNLFRLIARRGIPVELRGGPRANRAALLALLPQARVLHWSGHGIPGEQGMAWQLADGPLHADSLANLESQPALVFSNACGRDADGLLGTRRLALGQAFLRMGAQHFVGSLWDLGDRASAWFASSFYGALLEGSDIGDALRAARAEVRQRGGESCLGWAGYVHFGDPRAVLFKAES